MCRPVCDDGSRLGWADSWQHLYFLLVSRVYVYVGQGNLGPKQKKGADGYNFFHKRLLV